MTRKCRISSLVLPTFLLVAYLVVTADAGFYKMMSDWMNDDGWESKGISFGIKSKGMTAIIPIPLPIPIFQKAKKDSGGDKGGDAGGGWEPPAESGGGGGWWR